MKYLSILICFILLIQIKFSISDVLCCTECAPGSFNCNPCVTCGCTGGPYRKCSYCYCQYFKKLDS